MKAHEILDAAAGHLKDRAKTYDKPEGERSMNATVQAFKAVTGHELTETQGWLFMALLKAVRSQQGEFKMDSFEDGAAYFALAGESAFADSLLKAIDVPDEKPVPLEGKERTCPEWAKWIAQDPDGSWFVYDVKPLPGPKCWLSLGKIYFLNRTKSNQDWELTLSEL